MTPFAAPRRIALASVAVLAASLVAVGAVPGSAGATHVEACDTASATAVVTPTGPSDYRPSSTTHAHVADIRNSEWRTTASEGWYPVILKDGTYEPGTMCFLGGSIVSDDTSTSWDTTWHKTVSLYTDHPYTTIRGTRIHRGGDCIGIKDPGDASLTRIQGVALTECGDDAIENDLMKNVEVVDSVVEGYVLFAGRGGSAGAEDGRNNTYTIDKVIGHLRPQVDVYKGTSPGNGPLFKRPNADGSQGYEPNHTITNSIFRVDQVPNHGDLSIPPGPHSGNTIVWTGSGAYPGEVPAGFTVTTDLSVWQNARDAWYAVPQADRSAPGVYRSGETTPPPPAPAPACSDLLDNDGDGRIDYSADPGCTSTTDTDETDPVVVPPAPTTGVLDRQVNRATDDVEERRVGGKNIPTSSSDLEIGLDGSNDQYVGVRFVDVAIPKGATITRAYIGFTADEAHSTFLQAHVIGHALDNAPTFTTTNYELSLRPRTYAAEDRWFITDPWVPGSTYATYDLSEIVQEIVNRPGWASGNAMSFITFLDGDTPGTRTAVAFDGSSSKAPTLHVEYTQ